MKRKITSAILFLTLVLLVSCRTTPRHFGYYDDMILYVDEPVAEESTIEETIDQEPIIEEEIQNTTPLWAIGDIGPNEGLVFECKSLFLEIGEPKYEVSSYEEAQKSCENGYRLPTVNELFSIYEQLFETELAELEWTYYWSCETIGEDSARVVNFDTGFEGSFYKDLDFISVIPVLEI